MTEIERMTRDIHDFVWGDMDWESASDLLSRISKSEEWMDFLLIEIENYELLNYMEERLLRESAEYRSLPSE